jgi:hypothetical protein
MKKNLLWVGLFGAAFGLIECAVVVYLRELYYPEGFSFPLKLISGPVAVTEILREAGTMVMLLAVAFLAGKTAIERFAYFIYAFAFWDIFYYLFLFILLGWPPSLLTWDILFLIPVSWTGPVLAPVINSLTMILMAVVLLLKKTGEKPFRFPLLSWILLITGSCVTVYAYTEDTYRFLLERFSASEIFKLSPTNEVLRYSSGFIPFRFDWTAFILAEILFLTAILLFARNRSTRTADQ